MNVTVTGAVAFAAGASPAAPHAASAAPPAPPSAASAASVARRRSVRRLIALPGPANCVIRLLLPTVVTFTIGAMGRWG